MRSLYRSLSRVLVSAVFLSIFGASPAYAQQSISGRVTDEATGLGIQNVRVFAHTAGSQFTSGFTNSTGNYTIPLAAPGTYFLRSLNGVGYIDELSDGTPCIPCFGNNQAQNLAVTGTPIAVSGSVTGIDFALRLGGRISGTITDGTTHVPLQGVQVALVDASGVNLVSGTTASNGFYTTGAGLPTGTYFAVATQATQGYMSEAYNDVPCTPCNVILSTPIAVTEELVTGNIDFGLSLGGRVSGTVTDSITGNPIAGVQIQVTSTIGNISSSTGTDASGNYITGNGLPTGTYVVRARDSGNLFSLPFVQGYIEEIFNDKPCPQVCQLLSGDTVSVTVGATTTDINFALTPGGRVAGVVTDAMSGAPLGGVTIQIFNATGRFFTTATSNDAGAYTSFAGLPTDTYYARTINPFGYINELFDGATCLGNCLVTSGLEIEVTSPGTTSGVDFALSPGGRISGRITGSGGVPLRNVGVSVYDSAGNNVAGGFGASSAVTNALGDYLTTVGLPTGDYYVRINNGLGYINELYNGNACLNFCDVTAGTLVHVDLGAITAGIDAELEPGGRVSGTVTFAGSGAPLSGINLQVYDASGVRVAFGATDGTGRYLTNAGLPTGTYFLRTFNQLGLVNSIYDGIECTMSCVATTGTTVAVTAGDVTSGKDFVLRPDDDPDGDGIASTIDLAPAALSDDFSDVLLEGSTSGTITGRNGWNLLATDVSGGGIFAPPLSIPIGTGVQLAITGSGAQPATVDTCSLGGAERVMLDVDGEIARFFCAPTTGSTSAFAVLALPVIELREPPTGAGTVVSLTTGQAATLGSPVTANSANTEAITVTFVDAAGVAFGSFTLDAGESVDAVVNADGSVTVTVLAGVVTLNVRGSEVTLSTGETQTSAPGPLELTAVGPVNFWLGLKNSDDVGTKFDVLAEVLKNGAVVTSGQVNNLAGGSSGFNNAIQRTINLALGSSVGLVSGDTVGLRLSVRIAEGVSGHRSGTARLWFNDAAANSRIGATIGGLANTYYLVSTTGLPATFRLNRDVPGPGPKRTVDVLVDKAKNGNAFKPFGAWTFVVP